MIIKCSKEKALKIYDLFTSLGMVNLYNASEDNPDWLPTLYFDRLNTKRRKALAFVDSFRIESGVYSVKYTIYLDFKDMEELLGYLNKEQKMKLLMNLDLFT